MNRSMAPLVIAAAIVASGCGIDSPAILHETATLRIASVSIGPANVFVIDRSGKRLMIDAAKPGDEEEIESKMDSLGIDPASIDYLILTHGHIDHAGTAAYFQRTHGIEVIAGSGDREIIRNQGRAEVCPTGTLARAIRFIGSGMEYDTFDIDIPIDAHFDLAALGIDGRILLWPGHTEGSLVVELDDQLFVGDLIRGGILQTEIPTTHFFMCDLEDNREKIRRLLQMQPEARWLPSHFGPFPAAAVREYLAGLH